MLTFFSASQGFLSVCKCHYPGMDIFEDKVSVPLEPVDDVIANIRKMVSTSQLSEIRVCV